MTDPFLQPMVDGARSYLTAHGFTSALYKLYPVETTDFTPIASAIAASKAPVVVLGSMPPDGYALIQDLIQDKYSPKILIEASGPDQGAAFVKAVGAKNTGGLMVPNTWFPGSTYYQNAQMVQLYLKMFGGTANNISADVAEAFASGQVLTQAVDHIKSTSNSDLQTYLHSNVTFQSVQGPVKFPSDGENARRDARMCSSGRRARCRTCCRPEWATRCRSWRPSRPGAQEADLTRDGNREIRPDTMRIKT